MRSSILFSVSLLSFSLFCSAVSSAAAVSPDASAFPAGTDLYGFSRDETAFSEFPPDDTALSEFSRDDTSLSGFSRDETALSEFPVENAGTDAVLVIDVSGSMKQSDPEYLCRSAALNLIHDLGRSYGSRAALITFSDTLQTVIPLIPLDSVSDENELVKELNSFIYTTGDTDIGTALEKAASILTEEDSSNAKCIFLLTDGEIDLPAAEDEEAAEKESLTRALMAVEESKAEGIVIHTVALDLSGNMDENLMNYVADSTGGTSSLVNSASALDEVFRNLSVYAAQQRQQMEETEAETSPEETMTEEETESETETETEHQAVPMVFSTGSVDSPVRLKGLLPNLCTAKLNLSDLFRLEGSTSGFTDSIRYTAYPDNNTLLTCRVENDMLLITGLKNGTARIEIIAEPAFYDSVNYDGVSYEPGTDGNVSNQASLSFTVEVDALIPSLWYLSAIPVFALITGVLIWFLRNRRNTPGQLSGSLQWYVRGENEKIFGMPGQTMADLKDYGSRVRLSELVRDDLLSNAPIDKVIITPAEEGIRITSKTSSCLIAAAGNEPERRLEMNRSGRFKVFCETAGGRAAVIALYTSDEEYKAEPSFEDDSGERTRLLI